MCAKIDVTIATEFSQQCFSKGIFFEKGFISILSIMTSSPERLWKLTNLSILPVTLLFNYFSRYDNQVTT